MGYIGNSLQQQVTQPATQFFSGNGSTTVFTLNQTPTSIYTVEVVVNNVQQNPQTSYSILGNVITFTQAPPSGSNNIYVNYNPIVTYVSQPGYGSVGANQLGSISTINSIGANLNLQTNGVSAVTVDQGQNVTFNGAGTVNFTSLAVTGTSAIGFASGTTAQRPTATTAQYRFNSTTGSTEYSVNGFWINEINGYTQILGKTSAVFQHTGGNQSWTVPSGITYIFVKMWGAGGGGGSYGGWRQGSTGGAGGYSEAIVPVVAGQSITIYVGGRGQSRPGTASGWPNGGGASTSGGDNQYAASGGGSSSIAVPTINSGSRCMFAGGGGGGGCTTGYARLAGGAGGGLVGEDGHIDVISYMGQTQNGKGGTQLAGGTAPVGASTTGGAGSYNQGGTNGGNTYGGGGGGGYYGGSSGCYNTGMSGGGGGSGFVHSSLIRAQTLTGVREYPPMANDPDALAYSNATGTRIGVGGDEGNYGNNGLVIFYY
jgi:hypothetical protein